MTKRETLIKISFIFSMLFLFLSGCSPIYYVEITPEEEKQVEEAAIQYMKDTHQLEFTVMEITKLSSGNYFIFGIAKDEEETPMIIEGKPGEFRDTYHQHRQMVKFIDKYIEEK